MVWRRAGGWGAVGFALVVVGGVILIAVLPPPPQPVASILEVQVMVDTGEGRVRWARVPLPGPDDALNVTRSAAASLNITLGETALDVVTMRVEGVVLPNRAPDGPYWHLLKWRQDHWTFPDLPARRLDVRQGDVLGWYYAADDPRWDGGSAWLGPWPMATPNDPWPSVRGEIPGSDALDRLNYSWSRSTGDVFLAGGQPLVLRGLVIAQGKSDLWGFDAATGAVAWRRYGAGGPGTLGAYNGSLHVVTTGPTGPPEVHRLTIEGQVLWTATLPSRLTAHPQAAQGLLLLPLEDSLMALDTGTGKPRWTLGMGDNATSALALAGDRAFVAFAPGGGTVALALPLGTRLWTLPEPSGVGIVSLSGGRIALLDQEQGMVVDHNGTVIARWEGLWSEATAVASDGTTVVIAGRDLLGSPAVLALDPSAGLRWNHATPTKAVDLWVSGGQVIATWGGSPWGGVEGLDVASGRAVWNLNSTVAPEGGQAVASKEGLYILGSNGDLIAFRTSRAPPLAPAAESRWPVALTWTVIAGALVGATAAALAAWRRGPR